MNTPRKVTPLTVLVFNSKDLWADHVYSISKLFDGFECEDFPVSCFLEWVIPTEEELSAMEDWVREEAAALKELVIASSEDENGAPRLKEGDTILIYLKGTTS